ncbi:hypothetical protein ABMY20_12980 [Tenacibaculum sp. SSH1-16]|uniref:hypothetical protein n=1 Tax=Tenacibaculum sp. SSH1-16 TaxID=3136667 RepID=UPI0032C48F61
MTKIKKRYGKWGGYLEKLIYEKPKRKVEKEKVNDPDYYVRVDNQFFIMNNGLIGNVYIYIGTALMILISLFILLRELKGVAHNILFYIFFYCLGAFFIAYHYTRPKKELVLNRLEGLITIPNTLYFKPYTMPFQDALAAWSVKNSGINPTGPSLSLLHPNGFTSTDVMGHEVIEDWSFIVWYMDKNRPLPPGSAFDEYRQADFERRKAAGFPMPLYPSSIPTPEATPEQQAERKRIGGW